MKKFFTLLLLTVLLAPALCAQSRLGDDGGAYTKRSQWGVDLGVGKMAITDGSVGFAGGVRYQYNIHRYIGIDAIGINYIGQIIRDEGLGPSVLQAMIGLRAKSPSLYEDVAGYLGFRAGYGYDFHMEEGGLACELNVGIHITPQFSLGYFFNMQKL